MTKGANEIFALRVMCFALSVIIFQAVFLIDLNYYYSLGSSYINIPDHEYYVGVVAGGELLKSLSSLNNYSISVFYYYAHKVFGVDLVLISLVVNFVVLIVAYAKIERMYFSILGRFLPLIYCFALTAVLQFSVLINKDSFSVLFYVVLLSFLLTRAKFDIFLILILAPMRIQYVVILVLLCFLSGVSKESRLKVLLRVILLYFICSTVSLFLERHGILLSHDNYADGGVSRWISILNANYFIGSYVLNWIKPVQYIYDLYRGAHFDWSVIGAWVYLSRLTLFFSIILFGYSFFKLVYMPWTYRRDRVSYSLSILISAFFLVYMISPVVHYRYFLGIAPVVLFSLFYLTEQQKNSPKFAFFQGVS
ncbi:hypothetical protein [Stutzerimonas stutzeri]|uniref:hypothetical protein n=1 Tax=Stutzerimonas TaxID=2901164 RepID=UPI001BB012C9|nr:hypothetical protein [Stutzerimonas stutzeri]QUE77612.1 hypothetical protein KCX70_08675 [Stutzerimonas stutzeri]